MLLVHGADVRDRHLDPVGTVGRVQIGQAGRPNIDRWARSC